MCLWGLVIGSFAFVSGEDRHRSCASDENMKGGKKKKKLGMLRLENNNCIFVLLHICLLFSLLSINRWLNISSCSLPVSAVQRSLQKTPFWRDRSHDHESARCKFHFHGLTGTNELLIFFRYTFQNSATRKKEQSDIVPRLHLALLSLS